MMESLYANDMFHEVSNAVCAGGVLMQHGKDYPWSQFDACSDTAHSQYSDCLPSHRKAVVCSGLEISREENRVISSSEIHFTDLKLGDGSTSEVYAAVWNGRHLALKIQRSTFFTTVLENEVQAVRSMGAHPCLVGMVGICVDLDAPILCYDLQHGGTLDDVLDAKVPDNMDPADRMVESLCWMEDVLSALHHLHSLQVPIAHRDVKPSNLFFSADRKRLRLGDFGLCKTLSSMAEEQVDEPVGSFRYMAPEAFLCEGVCDAKVDIWAAGLVMWACAVRSRPFDALEDHDAAQVLAMRGLLLPIECVPHHGLQGLIRRALNRQPADRPTAFELLESLADLKRGMPGPNRRGRSSVKGKLMSSFKAIRSMKA